MAAPSYVNFSTRVTSTTANITPGLPSGMVTGYLLIAFIVTKGNDVTHSGPAGWQEIPNSQILIPGVIACSMWWRIVDGTETAPTFTLSGTATTAGYIMQYAREPYDTLNPFGFLVSNTGSGTTHTSTGAATTRANSRMIYVDVANANTAVATASGWSEKFDVGGSTPVMRLAVGDKTVATLGTNSGNISIVGANSSWIQYQIELLEPVFDGTILGTQDSGDGYEVSGTVTTSGSSILIGNNAGVQQKGLFRFTSLSVPAGKQLKRARMSFTPSVISGTDFGQLYADVVGGAPTWATEPINSFRASVNYVQIPVGTVGIRTFMDMTEAVKEILALPGWVNGNAVRFYTDYGSSPSGAITVGAAEGGGGSAPKLFLEFEDIPGGITPKPFSFGFIIG